MPGAVTMLYAPSLTDSERRRRRHAFYGVILAAAARRRQRLSEQGQDEVCDGDGQRPSLVQQVKGN